MLTDSTFEALKNAIANGDYSQEDTHPFKKDVVSYLKYVYELSTREAKDCFSRASKEYADLEDILVFADELAEDIYEEKHHFETEFESVWN